MGKIFNIIISVFVVGFVGCGYVEPLGVDELAVDYCELFTECSPNFGPNMEECIQTVHSDLADKEGECYNETVNFLECLANLSCEEVETEILENCYAAQDIKLAACR